MSEVFAPEEFLEAMYDAFDRGQELSFIPSGRSMLPMLNGVGDKVTLSAKPDKLKKYDVAFYRRPDSGGLVLHRMIGFDKRGGYIFSGDGQYVLEYGVTDDDVLALMTAYTHNGKARDTVSLPYRVYSRLIVLKKCPRRVASRIYHKLLGR